MVVRVTRMSVDLSREDDVRKYLDTELLPMLKANPGFRHYYAAVDRQSGEAISFTMYDSDDQAQFTAEQQQAMASRLSELGINVQERRIYEMTAEV